MEIEPDETEIDIAQTIDYLLELSSQHFLFFGSFLVDKIDHANIIEVLPNVIDVLLAEIAVNLIVSNEFTRGRPLQVWFLSPFEWHGATCLNK